jgi:hypothetical protein
VAGVASRVEREMVQAVTAVEELLDRAVAATVADRSPAPARETAALVERMDARAEDADVDGPIELLATLTLVGRLAALRDAPADGTDRVAAALTWVEEALGRRCRARAAFVSALLVTEDAADDVARYRDALRGEFLPALLWLLAGADQAAGTPAR